MKKIKLLNSGDIICLQKLFSHNETTYRVTYDSPPYTSKKISKKRYNQLSQSMVKVLFTGHDQVLEVYEPLSKMYKPVLEVGATIHHVDGSKGLKIVDAFQEKPYPLALILENGGCVQLTSIISFKGKLVFVPGIDNSDIKFNF